MSRWESWAFGTLHVVLALTGGVYFSMKYVLRTDDPFAVVNHPWQPVMLTGHVLAAPFGMVLFGIVFRSHILNKLASRNGPGRRSGWTALVSFTAMAVSGYLLQVMAHPTPRRAVMVVHVVTSVIFVVGYSTHLLTGLLLPRERRLVNAEGAAEPRSSLPT
jgi:hypothetical protein